MEEVTNITSELPTYKRILFSGANRSHIQAIHHASDSTCRFEISL
jgi:phosphoheptose isomerase